ncbi:hypothetical protein DL96DRAFT_961311 [Flagelloscypha sp. PMI_526]|nr:hypothetical protein DL96DRAFT_961311 [Flagelloscypha sp. PMI_526]
MATASQNLYEVSLSGDFYPSDLKAVINRITLHSESSKPFHAHEIIFEPLDAQAQREAGGDPILLRARKELTDPESGWALFSYLKAESARTHPNATVRPWATCQVVGDAPNFALALGYQQRSQVYKRGFRFKRGLLVIQLSQQEQFDPNTQQPITAQQSTLWEVEVRTAEPVQNTPEKPLKQYIDAVLEIQTLMKGLLDLQRQDF